MDALNFFGSFLLGGLFLWGIMEKTILFIINKIFVQARFVFHELEFKLCSMYGGPA